MYINITLHAGILVCVCVLYIDLLLKFEGECNLKRKAKEGAENSKELEGSQSK